MSLSQLPPDAQYRYRNMQDELEEAFNLIQSLQKRIKDTELIIGNFNEDQIAEAQPYIDDHTRQSQRIAAARAEHNALALVHTTVRTWIDMLNVNVRYEDVHMREYKLPKGVTYSQAIEEIRMQIDDLIGSRNRASTSVPPVEDLYALSDADVDKAADAYDDALRLIITDGKPIFHYPDPRNQSKDAWLFPERVKERQRMKIDRNRKRELMLGLAVMDKATARELVKATEEQLVAVERREEAIIRAAASQGTHIPRRAQASPLAILSIRLDTSKRKMMQAA